MQLLRQAAGTRNLFHRHDHFLSIESRAADTMRVEKNTFLRLVWKTLVRALWRSYDAAGSRSQIRVQVLQSALH